MTTLTPIEAALWSTGVAIQAGLALKIFGGVLFTGFVVLFFMKFCHKALSSVGEGQDSIGTLKSLSGYGLMVLLGLSFTRTVSQGAFSPVDGSDRKWSDYVFVSTHPKFQALQESKDGLYWYLIFQKGANELSNFVTGVITSLFNDQGYNKSPDMLFKILVNTASVSLDDPSVTIKLDELMGSCSDTKKAKIMDESKSLFYFLDLENPDCFNKYKNVQESLKTWAKAKTPTYLKKATDEPNESYSWAVRKFTNEETLENKIIASALVSYAKDKARAYKDNLNLDRKALGITSDEDWAWLTLQKALSGGALPAAIGSLFTGDGSTEAGIHRNEARIVYNNLYNLIPSFRGYVKIFLAVFFILASAALSLGFSKPLLMWFSALLMDAAYMPTSALNYEIHALIMSAGDIGARFGELSKDPMILMGAAAIDSQLLFFQTTYFLMQFVIAAILVVGVVYSGFAVNKMSFGQGAVFGGVIGSLGGNRIASIASEKLVTSTASKAGQGAVAIVNKVRGRSVK